MYVRCSALTRPLLQRSGHTRSADCGLSIACGLSLACGQFFDRALFGRSNSEVLAEKCIFRISDSMIDLGQNVSS